MFTIISATAQLDRGFIEMHRKPTEIVSKVCNQARYILDNFISPFYRAVAAADAERQSEARRTEMARAALAAEFAEQLDRTFDDGSYPFESELAQPDDMQERQAPSATPEAVADTAYPQEMTLSSQFTDYQQENAQLVEVPFSSTGGFVEDPLTPQEQSIFSSTTLLFPP